ncbi:MAG: transglycosylase SLT domain-containing protein [Pseudonocardia sp.]|nr:transglycosylase SLT domain-containing protein [Pseudonocardia sp.]
MRGVCIAGGVLIAVLLLPLILIATVLGGLTAATPATAVNASAVPALASEQLGTISAVTAGTCPELPPVWVVAHVEAESGWDPAAFSRDVNGGAAGLYQLNEANWRAAGGARWPSTPPAASSDILQPEVHLHRAIPWICNNLRIVTAHLRVTRKPTGVFPILLTPI